MRKFRRLPLEEHIRRNQAASTLDGLSKGWGSRQRLCPGVDCGEGDFGVFDPEWNQAPLHDGEFAPAGLMTDANNRLAAGGRDVVAGCKL